MSDALRPINRENLTSRVCAELRTGLLAGRFWPGERLKIRDLARAMDVSETPVREAILQLATEGAFELVAGRSIRVVNLSLPQYLELRQIRLVLEGLAAEVATGLITEAEIDRLVTVHAALAAAQAFGDWRDAVQHSHLFHFGLYRVSGMTELVNMLERIWLRTGPLLNLLYSHAPPSYPGRHHHMAVIDGLRARDAAAVRRALADDLIQGGSRLVALMEDIEAGRISIMPHHQSAFVSDNASAASQEA